MPLIDNFSERIDKFLDIDKLKTELKAMQNATFAQLYSRIYPTWTSYKVLQALKVVDEVFAVIHKLAKTAAKIPLYGYDKDGEYLPDSDKMVQFLRTLTYTRRIELFTWLFLFDECFCYKEKTLGVNGKVDKMIMLNPGFITLVVTDTFPESIAYYLYRDPVKGYEKRIELDEMIFIRGFNPTNDSNERWRGLSKIDVLTRRLNRLESNMKNSVAQIQNGGTPGVLYVKNATHDSKSKPVIDGIKTNYSNFAKNPDNTGAPFIQAGDFGYIQLGLSLVDLDSTELAKLDLKGICNVFGVSDVWFNSDSSSTESNVKEMIRQAYTVGIMPYTQMVEDAFNLELVTDFGTGFRTVKFDYSEIQELQQSLKERMDGLAAAPVMIPNDVLEAAGYDRVDDEMMDKPFIKSGYEPLDSFTQIQDTGTGQV